MKTVLRHKRRFICVQCWNKTPEINQGRGAREIGWVSTDIKQYKCSHCGVKGYYLPISKH